MMRALRRSGDVVGVRRSREVRESENERGVGDRKMEKLNWIPFFLCNYQKLEILHTSVNTRNSVRYTRKHKQFITVAVSTFNLTVSRIHFTKILESFPLRKFRETSQIINHSGPGINLRLEYLLKRGNLSRFPTELGRCSRYKPVSICNYMHPPPLRYSRASFPEQQLSSTALVPRNLSNSNSRHARRIKHNRKKKLIYVSFGNDHHV